MSRSLAGKEEGRTFQRSKEHIERNKVVNVYQIIWRQLELEFCFLGLSSLLLGGFRRPELVWQTGGVDSLKSLCMRDLVENRSNTCAPRGEELGQSHVCLGGLHSAKLLHTGN